MTALGITLNAIDMEKFRIASLISYIALGWAVVAMWGTLKASLAAGGIALLLAGGLVYMLGVVFYCMKKVAYMHSIWHIFVLAGSILHFFAVLLYVIR